MASFLVRTYEVCQSECRVKVEIFHRVGDINKKMVNVRMAMIVIYLSAHTRSHISFESVEHQAYYIYRFSIKCLYVQKYQH